MIRTRVIRVSLEGLSDDTKGRPSSELMSSKRIRRIGLELGLVLLLLAVTLFLQRASGAYSSAFGAEPDEASHYVTAVMIRDYIAQGFPGNPLTFAKNFYLHYPRVAFGLWPPLFHVVSGVWMTIFGVGRTSVLFLLVAFTVSWAWVLYRAATSLVGSYGAALSALLLVLLPITQRYTSSVMIDVPLAMTMLLAMLAYGRYLVSERALDAALFGLFAALALLVKYNSLALILLPPLCVILTGRYYLLRTKAFWLPAFVVLLIAGPWYVTVRRLVFYAAEPGSGLSPFGLGSLVTSAQGIVWVAGPVVFVLGLIGGVLLALRRLRSPETSNPNLWALYSVSTAMVLAVFLFHVFYPLFETRYSLPAAPALILLSWATIDFVRSRTRHARWLVAVGSLLLVVQTVLIFQVPRKTGAAYVTTANAVLHDGLQTNGAVLVSADASGEGMLTAEFVMSDRRPDHYVVRASKMLATQTLMRDNYHLLYTSPKKLMTALDSIPISYVIMQQCPPGSCGEHEKLLALTAQQYPDRFWPMQVIPAENGAPISIYRIKGNEGKPARALSIDMAPTLGTTLRLE